jgi:hypothetical protein
VHVIFIFIFIVSRSWQSSPVHFACLLNPDEIVCMMLVDSNLSNELLGIDAEIDG